MQEEQLSKENLEQILTKNINIDKLRITGENAHFNLMIVSNEFTELSIIKRHKLVYNALGDAFSSNKLHALSINALSPGEFNKQKNFL